MNIIVLINIALVIVIFIGIAVVIKGWKKTFYTDTKLIFIILLFLILIYRMITIAEWSRYPELDPLEDLIETLVPLLWVFFFYAFLKEVDERKIKRSEKKYRELFKSLRSGIVVHGPDGDIISANPAAEEALGIEEETLKKMQPKDWKGKFYKENGNPMDVDEFPVSKVLNSGEVYEGKMIGIASEGNKEVKWYAISAIPYFDEEGEIEKVITSFEDVNETKKAEERKNFLNTMIRQDLQSNYSIVQGYLELLQQNGLSEENQEYLEKGLKASKRIDGILQMAKDLKMIEEIGWKDELDVATEIQHAIRDLSSIIEEKDIEVEEKYPDRDLRTRGDYSLRKLFNHLLKTRIQVSRCDRFKIKVEEERERIKVIIEDDGEDLPVEIKEIFSGKTYEGETSGAGGVLYYIIKKIAEHNEAKMEVNRTDSEWTRFEVLLKKES
ncbi:MAG: PAS domain-containing sensor histidine kinase [Candidatus Thermoplasmatota archaeon]